MVWSKRDSSASRKPAGRKRVTAQKRDERRGTDTVRRQQTMPGIGPLIALAVEAFAPNMAHFRCGRDFAARLGLVPRQHSSGGKERLGRVSKAGQTDIRGFLVVGAMSRLNWLGRKSISERSWLARLMATVIRFGSARSQPGSRT